MSQLTYVLNKQYKQTVLLSLIMLVVECPRVKCMNFHPSTSCLFFICQAHNILHYENFTNYFLLSMIVLLLDLILLMFDLLHHYQLLPLAMYVFIFNSPFYGTLYLVQYVIFQRQNSLVHSASPCIILFDGTYVIIVFAIVYICLYSYMQIRTSLLHYTQLASQLSDIVHIGNFMQLHT